MNVQINIAVSVSFGMGTAVASYRFHSPEGETRVKTEHSLPSPQITWDNFFNPRRARNETPGLQKLHTSKL